MLLRPVVKRIALIVLAAAAVYGYLEYQKSSGGAAGKKIALSNNYAGNSWRQSMLKSWDKVTKKAVADGVVAEATPFTTSENQVTEQAAQIQNLILQGYDAIVINSASPDALNADSTRDEWTIDLTRYRSRGVLLSIKAHVGGPRPGGERPALSVNVSGGATGYVQVNGVSHSKTRTS